MLVAYPLEMLVVVVERVSVRLWTGKGFHAVEVGKRQCATYKPGLLSLRSVAKTI